MKILAIESSALAASVCVECDGKLVAESFQNNGLTHSKTVMAMLENMLKSCGEKLENMDKIAASAGPGSFTGLRIGVSVAKGLSWSSGVPVCGVSTLEAMAWQAASFDGVVCPVMDARAGQVYNGLFKSRDGELERVCEDRAIALKDLTDELKNYEDIMLLGDGAHLLYDKLSEMGISARMMPEALRFPRASGVARAARDMEADAPEKLEIKYLRLPQAERERLARMNNKSEVKHKKSFDKANTVC